MIDASTQSEHGVPTMLDASTQTDVWLGEPAPLWTDEKTTIVSKRLRRKTALEAAIAHVESERHSGSDDRPREVAPMSAEDGTAERKKRKVVSKLPRGKAAGEATTAPVELGIDSGNVEQPHGVAPIRAEDETSERRPTKRKRGRPPKTTAPAELERDRG